MNTRINEGIDSSFLFNILIYHTCRVADRQADIEGDRKNTHIIKKRVKGSKQKRNKAKKEQE